MRSPLHLRRCVLIAVVVVFLCGGLGHAQQLLVTSDKPDGVYDVGQPITWRIEWKGSSPIVSARYALKQGGLTTVREEDLSFTDNVATLQATLDQPGWLLAEIKLKSADEKEHRALGGALAAAEKLAPSSPRPDDFDSFWDAKIEQLRRIPANAQLTSADSGRADVDYWKTTMDNIAGSHIQGQLARPKAGEKLPALLVVQWAGVYGLDKSWITGSAAEGWLVLNISAHDLPIDQPESFYREQDGGALNNYPAIGNEDRETSYFLRMYLSCYQAAEYLTQRSDWDGRTLVVTGGSQGGQQTFVTAALHPKITAALANVPAGCDMTGPDAGRAPGWPMWYWQTGGRDAQKVHEASRYFDVIHFAPRIKCPMLVGVGLIDETCPPAGIFAALNQVQGAKEVILLPNGDHMGTHNSHAPYYARYGAWMGALREGKGAPVR